MVYLFKTFILPCCILDLASDSYASTTGTMIPVCKQCSKTSLKSLLKGLTKVCCQTEVVLTSSQTKLVLEHRRIIQAT